MDSAPRRRGNEGGELITDVARIRRIFHALGHERIVGRTLDDAGHALAQITALPTPAREGDVTRWDYEDQSWRDGQIVEIAGLLSLFRFALVRHAFIDGRLLTKLPSRIERVGHRAERRASAPPVVALRYKSTDGRAAIRDVHDVSRHGIAFAVSASRDVMAVGSQIHDVTIDWQSRLRVRATLTLRHVSEDFGEGRRIAGATLTFASQEDAEHWDTEVGKLLAPRTRIGGSWTGDIWELFDKSGYFGLSEKSEAHFLPLRDTFVAASRKLARAPQLGAQVVWPSSRGVEASVALVALNHHAAFLFHVARRHGNPPEGTTGRQILYEIYERALTWLHRSSFVRWLVVWVQDAGSFSKRLHLDFTERHADGERCCIVPFRTLELPVDFEPTSRDRLITASGGVITETPPWLVRPAADHELESIAMHAAARYPPAFCEAMELRPPFDRHWSEWDDTALMRGRDVVVAERDGVVRAAAIIECAEDGIHLFGLLDALRIVPLGAWDEDAATALLQHGRRLFEQLGKRAFIYCCDPERPPSTWPTDAVDLGLTHCTVFSTAELLPQFNEHLWELTMSSVD